MSRPTKKDMTSSLYILMENVLHDSLKLHYICKYPFLGNQLKMWDGEFILMKLLPSKLMFRVRLTLKRANESSEAEDVKSIMV